MNRTDITRCWYQETKQGWSDGQHTTTTSWSKRPGLEHKIDRGRGLPHQTGPKIQPVEGCPWDITALKSGVQDEGSTTYLDHKQVDEIVYSNVCTKYGLEVLGSKWMASPKVIEKDQVEILGDLLVSHIKVSPTQSPQLSHSKVGLHQMKCKSSRRTYTFVVMAWHVSCCTTVFVILLFLFMHQVFLKVLPCFLQNK